MRSVLSIGAIAVFAMAGTANAGIQFSSSTNDTSNLTSDFATLHNGGDSSNLVLNNISGALNTFISSDMLFGSASSAINSSANGNFNVSLTNTEGASPVVTGFYLGMAGNLSNAYFDAGQTPRPADSTITLAFGNNEYSANEVTLDFNPDSVTAFGFNYEDIGDVGSTLTVSYANGTSETLNLATYGADGYVSIVSAANTTIGSITLTQVNPQNNDGFAFYGFSTVQVVPVPTAALAGLGLLGGMGIARRIRRR